MNDNLAPEGRVWSDGNRVDIFHRYARVQYTRDGIPARDTWTLTTAKQLHDRIDALRREPNTKMIIPVKFYIIGDPSSGYRIEIGGSLVVIGDTRQVISCQTKGQAVEYAITLADSLIDRAMTKQQRNPNPGHHKTSDALDDEDDDLPVAKPRPYKLPATKRK